MKKGRIIKTIKKIDKKQIIAVLILLLIATLSIGYSAFSSKLSIEGAIAEVRIKKDVRVTGVKVSNLNASAGGISLYEEYGVDFIEGKIELPKEDAKVIYDVSITNIGNVDIGILELTNLPDNLEYKILNYNLKDKICNESGTCKLGITKDIQIEIGYKEGMYNVENTTFNFKLNFNFQQVYTITYTNIEAVTNYPKEVLGGDTLVIENMPRGISVKQEEVSRNFTYEDGILTVENVEGNLEIVKKDFILATGKNFNVYIKKLTGGNVTVYNTTDTTIKKIEFLTDGKLPEGYTKEDFFALKSSDVSVKQDKAIMAYYSNGTIYIYSDGEIQANVDSSCLFYYLKSLTNIDGLNKIDISQATSMVSMFYGCESLTTLDLSNLNTSALTDMGSMFFECRSLTSLDISNLDVRKVTSISNFFYNCKKLKTVNMSGLNFEKLKSMSSLFSGLTNLTTLSLAEFNTSQVTNMSSMFYNCSSLASLDLSSFDTSAVTNTGSMFYGCSSLASLDLSSFDTGAVTNMSSMFSGCGSLASLDLNSFDTGAVTNMSSMFRGCSSLASLDLSGFDTSAVTNMNRMVASCRSLINLNLSNFNTSRVIDMSYMFYNCSSLASLDLSSFDTGAVTNMSYMFYSCSSLASLDLSGFDTSAVTNMSYMFNSCGSLASLDLSSFDTGAVTNMSYMFYSCSSLASLDLSSFDTGAVTNMSYMFYSCSSLASLDLSGFDTSAVTNMSSMFYNCSILTSLNLSNFNTAKVTNMNSMFYKCSSLTTLDLSSFDTSAVIAIGSMFNSCSKLTSVDFRNATFKITASTYYSNMFAAIPSVTVTVKDETAQTWLTSKFSNVNAVIYEA